MLRFFSLIILLFDNYSLRVVDLIIRKSFKILFTVYAISVVGEIIAFVSQ